MPCGLAEEETRLVGEVREVHERRLLYYQPSQTSLMSNIINIDFILPACGRTKVVPRGIIGDNRSRSPTPDSGSNGRFRSGSRGFGAEDFDFQMCWTGSMNQRVSMGSRRNMRQTRVGCASTTQFLAAGVLCAAFIILALAGGCQPTKVTKSAHIVPGTTIQAMDMNSPLEPQEIGGAVQLSAAKNEWISFAVRIGNLPQTNLKPALQLHVSPTMAMENFSAYQVLPMPVATNRAGYVRQTGLAAGAKLLPRALLPMRCENGVVDLSTLRNPAHPFDPQSRADGDSKPAIVWIDIHVPSDAPTADYTITCGLGFPGQTPAPSGVQVSLHVFDFAIPQDRHLLMVSDINWDRLRQLYPDNFEAITPRLMNRDDHTYAAAIKTLDQLVSLAERNRTEVVVAAPAADRQVACDGDAGGRLVGFRYDCFAVAERGCICGQGAAGILAAARRGLSEQL